MAYKKRLKKQKRQIDSVNAHVLSTFNNTIVSITTVDGDVLFQSSAGKLGFKGSRKGTPFAATQVGGALAKDILALGVRRVEKINVQGPGSGRDSIPRALQQNGLEVFKICDVTPLPHNGCRPPKKRRV